MSSRGNFSWRGTVYPLTLEPHHEGRSVHLIAWDLPIESGAFRTLKVERIHVLELENPAPELLSRIPVEQLRPQLSTAWSIWTSEQTPVPVTLRFSADVADRVQETLWHRTQQVDRQSDGTVIWKAQIAEPKEMYPWIRGWGPDVEILEPPELRARHREDFVRGKELYSHNDDAS